MISPCLHVLTLWRAHLRKFGFILCYFQILIESDLVHVDNLEPLSFPETMPEPVLHHNQLHNLLSLVERQGAEASTWDETYGETLGRSIVALLTGMKCRIFARL
jgi:hypothetical protein